MNQLINIKEENGKQLVSARELYDFLEVGRDFTTWIKGRIDKYEFIADVDFIVLNLAHQNGGASWGGNNKVDYALTLDMAKELSMIENNEKGKEARKYFIKCEKQLLQQNDVKAIKGMEQVVNQLQEKIDTLSKYCKINCSLKHQFIEYIKKRLGIRVTNSEYEQVKARIFLVLGVTKWEEIDFELKEKVLNLIDESIKIIKSERPYEQRTFWD